MVSQEPAVTGKAISQDSRVLVYVGVLLFRGSAWWLGFSTARITCLSAGSARSSLRSMPFPMFRHVPSHAESGSPHLPNVR